MRGTEFFETIAAAPSLSGIHPKIGTFFRNYLGGEKAVRFGDRWVLNTNFPPFPSRAFDGLAAQLQDASGRQSLYSVTLAVTNRCVFKCWHCYNAGRSQRDVPLHVWRDVAAKLQDDGAVMIDLTGGEPLLRADLEQICAGFDARSCVIVGTTGWDLTADRARSLRDAGVFGVGISLDSADEREHDQRRGREGAFRAVARALAAASAAGLYPYVVAVAMRELLEPGRFYSFLRSAGDLGALEVHLLEPCPTGRIAGRADLVLTAAERERIVAYQHAVAQRDDLPILSTFTYIEGADAFGCGAGLTHIYIDGSGELCPCNLVPLSFGNIANEPLQVLLARMRQHFRQPRATCVGRLLTPHIGEGELPTPPGVSCALCEQHLPKEHEVPEFFRLRALAREGVGASELAQSYDRVYEDYDDFWTVEAGAPVKELVQRLTWHGAEKVFEAGCGSGFATVLLAGKLTRGGALTAVDISERMQSLARRRVDAQALGNVEFICGDALETLRSARDLDLVFSSWVLGYIPVGTFLAAACQALKPAGRLAFLVHKENSPRREFELFARLVARDPSVLLKPVSFGFPRDAGHVREQLLVAGLEAAESWEGSCLFRYPTAEQVLEHLLKSGAGTVFYEAVDPAKRADLTEEFLALLREQRDSDDGFVVRHDYVSCIAGKR
jgi:MoaA/NifB/PqqE/SkfB family radical SAM enzyme/SAM-dependent methyltransferase